MDAVDRAAANVEGKGHRRFGAAIRYIAMAVALTPLILADFVTRGLMVLVVVWYLFARSRRVLRDWVPGDLTNAVVVFLIAAIPALAHGYGHAISVEIRDNESYNYIRAADFDHDRSRSDTTHVKLIGRLGDYYMFTDLENQVVFVRRYESINHLNLRRFDDE